MQTNLPALKTIKCYLKAVYRKNGIVVVMFFCGTTLVVVVLLTCPPVLEVFRFFFPLLVSTGLCLTAVYEFILSENHQGGDEVINSEDGNDMGISILEAPHQYCYSRFTFNMEDARVEVGRVPLLLDATSMDGYLENESSYLTVVKVVPVEGEKVKRVIAENNGGFEEDEEQLSSLSRQVHSFAEGVWDCYFGRDTVSDD